MKVDRCFRADRNVIFSSLVAQSMRLPTVAISDRIDFDENDREEDASTKKCSWLRRRNKRNGHGSRRMEVTYGQQRFHELAREDYMTMKRGEDFTTGDLKYDIDPGSWTIRNKTHRTVQSLLDAFDTLHFV